MKEKVKKVFIRIMYIFFALFASIALWLFVEITENDLQVRDITITLDGIVLSNRELMESKGLLISSIPTDEVVLTFEGPRREINNLTSGSVSLEIDLETIRTVGTHSLSYDVLLPDGVNGNAVTIKNSTTSQILVVIDRRGTRQFRVEADYSGGLASEDLMVGNKEISPADITITGPEELVSRIAHVYVPIPATNLSATYADERSFLLIDIDGEEISPEYFETGTLTASNDTIAIRVPVLQMKTLPLYVEFLHGKTTDETNVEWEIEPREIVVSGDPDAIREFSNNILLGTIDMNAYALTFPQRDFAIILPDYLNNESNVTSAKVSMRVINLSRGYRSVPNSNIQVTNVPAGYTATVLTQSLDVVLRGTDASLASVSAENISVTSDLSELPPGTTTARNSARASIVGTNAQVDIIGDYSIVVSLTADNGG